MTENAAVNQLADGELDEIVDGIANWDSRRVEEVKSWGDEELIRRVVVTCFSKRTGREELFGHRRC